MLCYKICFKVLKTLVRSCKEIFISFLHLFISATLVKNVASKNTNKTNIVSQRKKLKLITLLKWLDKWVSVILNRSKLSKLFTSWHKQFLNKFHLPLTEVKITIAFYSKNKIVKPKKLITTYTKKKKKLHHNININRGQLIGYIWIPTTWYAGKIR